nr:mucin-17-like [Cherax quadricarinatus]
MYYYLGMKAAVGAAAAITGAGALIYVLLRSRQRQRDPGKDDDSNINLEENITTVTSTYTDLKPHLVEGSSVLSSEMSRDSKDCEDKCDSQYENLNGHVPVNSKNSEIILVDHVSGAKNGNSVTEITNILSEQNNTIYSESDTKVGLGEATGPESSTAIPDKVVTDDLLDKSLRDSMENEKVKLHCASDISVEFCDGVTKDDGVTPCPKTGLKDTESSSLCTSAEDKSMSECTFSEILSDNPGLEVKEMTNLSHVAKEDSCSPSFMSEVKEVPLQVIPENICLSTVVLSLNEVVSLRDSNVPNSVSEKSLKFASSRHEKSSILSDLTPQEKIITCSSDKNKELKCSLDMANVESADSSVIVQVKDSLTSPALSHDEHTVVSSSYNLAQSTVSNNLREREVSTHTPSVAVNDKVSVSCIIGHGEHIISLNQYDSCSLSYEPNHEETSLASSLGQEEQFTLATSLNQEDTDLSSSLASEEQSVCSFSLDPEHPANFSGLNTSRGTSVTEMCSGMQEEIPTSLNLTQEEAFISSDLVQEDESILASSLVQEGKSTHSSVLVQEEEFAHSSSLIQEEVSTHSSSFIQKEESTHSSSLVQGEKPVHSSSLVQGEESTHSSSLVQGEESTHSSSLVQGEESTHSSSLAQGEESTHSSSLVQGEESTFISNLVQGEESIPLSSLVQEESLSSLIQENWTQSSSLVHKASIPSSLVQEEFTPSLVQEEFPASTLVQEESAASTFVQEESAASTLVQKESAAPGLAQEESAVSTLVQEEFAASTFVQEESVASSLVQEESAASSLVQEESAVSSLVQEVSAVSTLVQEESAASTLVQEESAASTLVQEESVASTFVQEESVASSLVQEESAVSSLVQEESAVSSLVQEVSAVSTLVQEESAASTLVQEESAASTLVQEESAPSTLVQEESAPSSLVKEESTPSGLAKEESIPASLAKGESTSSLVLEESTPPSLVLEESTPPSLVLEESTPPSLVLEESTLPSLILEESSSSLVLEESISSLVLEESMPSSLVQGVSTPSSSVQEESTQNLIQEESTPSSIQEESTPSSSVQEECTLSLIQKESAPSSLVQEASTPLGLVQRESAPSVVHEESTLSSSLIHEESTPSFVQRDSACSSGLVQEDSPLSSSLVQKEHSVISTTLDQEAKISPRDSPKHKSLDKWLEKKCIISQELSKTCAKLVGTDKKDSKMVSTQYIEKKNEIAPSKSLVMETVTIGKKCHSEYTQKNCKQEQKVPDKRENTRIGTTKKENSCLDTVTLNEGSKPKSRLSDNTGTNMLQENTNTSMKTVVSDRGNSKKEHFQNKQMDLPSDIDHDAISEEENLNSDSLSLKSVDSGQRISLFMYLDFMNIFVSRLVVTLVGRLIGRKGAFVNKIKATTDATVIVHPHRNRRFKLCSVEGKFKSINTLVYLKFVYLGGIWPIHGIQNKTKQKKKIQLTFIVNRNISLADGTVCVAQIKGQWMRCQVLNTVDNVSLVVLLDVGGTTSVLTSSLRQVRYDYMTLPFQATQCFLHGIEPVIDDTSVAVMEELVSDTILFANVVSYTEDGVPLVNLYRRDSDQYVHLNEKLVLLGHAQWMSQEPSG